MADPITEQDVVNAVRAHERLMADSERMYRLSRDLGGSTAVVLRRYGKPECELKNEEVLAMSSVANKYGAELQQRARDVLRGVMPPKSPSPTPTRSWYRALADTCRRRLRG